MGASAVICVIVVALLGGGVAATAAKSPGRPAAARKFCDPDRPARSFGFPSLPPIHEVEERSVGAELGHPKVAIDGGEGPEVLTEPHRVGFLFSELGSTNPVLVHWTVTEELWKLDRHGGSAVEVGHTGAFITPIDLEHDPFVGMKTPDRLGFYRLDLRIIERGKTIGTYSSYLKLLPPTSRARLRPNHRVVRPGEQILGCLENLGTEQVDLGFEFDLQRREDGSWDHVPGLAEGPWAFPLILLFPGEREVTSGLRLPPGLEPGEYRLAQRVEESRRHKKAIDRTLTAPFTVALR
jgi:hypothetical protein